MTDLLCLSQRYFKDRLDSPKETTLQLLTVSKAVYFGESKRSSKLRSDERKRSVKNCDRGKNEIVKLCWEAYHEFSWDQKKVVEKECRLIPGKIKETIHSLRNLNHVKKNFNMLPETWLPDLR